MNVTKIVPCITDIIVSCLSMAVFHSWNDCWSPSNVCVCVCVCVVACYPGSFRCIADGSCVSSHQYCNRYCICPLCTDEVHCHVRPHQRITFTPYSSTTTARYPTSSYPTSSRYPSIPPVYTTTTQRYRPYPPVTFTSPHTFPPYPPRYTTTTQRYPPYPPVPPVPPYSPVYTTTTQRHPQGQSYLSKLPPYHHAILSHSNIYRPINCCKLVITRVPVTIRWHQQHPFSVLTLLVEWQEGQHTLSLSAM